MKSDFPGWYTPPEKAVFRPAAPQSSPARTPPPAATYSPGQTGRGRIFLRDCRGLTASTVPTGTVSLWKSCRPVLLHQPPLTVLVKQSLHPDAAGKDTADWVRYQVGGKMFAAICLDQEDKPYYINLKLEPAEGEFLRSQYPDIIPGFYSNKEHWNL